MPRFSPDDYLLQWHVADYAESGDKLVAYIVDFELDPALRGLGVGAEIYQQWEKKLPKTIKYVVIHAVSSVGFWEAMGFKPRYDFEIPFDAEYADSEIMIKGIRGTRTPRPLPPIEDEDA